MPAGAAAVLVERDTAGDLTPTCAALIAVPDPLIALGADRGRGAAAIARARVGITGSTGKTSTKDILAALLRRADATVASPANFNTEIGLPLTLCRIERRHRGGGVRARRCAALGQIAYLAEICRARRRRDHRRSARRTWS